MRKNSKVKGTPTEKQAREAAARWWEFASATIAELIQSGARLRREVLRPGSPLFEAVDEDQLWEFLDALEEANMHLAVCHPIPAVEVNVPDPLAVI